MDGLPGWAAFMAKQDFLMSLRTARNLFAHRVQTDHPSLDPQKLEGQLSRAAIWLTPSAVKGFDIREFQELPPELRTELKDSVEQFVRVANDVRPNEPATNEQISEGMSAFRRMIELLQPYLPTQGELEQVRDALESVQFPEFVLSWDFELGEDSTGDPAVWVWVIVRDDAADRPDFTKVSTGVEWKIREAFVAKGLGRWPFVRFRTASEQRAL